MSYSPGLLIITFDSDSNAITISVKIAGSMAEGAPELTFFHLLERKSRRSIAKPLGFCNTGTEVHNQNAIRKHKLKQVE